MTRDYRLLVIFFTVRKCGVIVAGCDFFYPKTMTVCGRSGYVVLLNVVSWRGVALVVTDVVGLMG